MARSRAIALGLVVARRRATVLWSDADGAGDVFVIDDGTGTRTRLTDSAEAGELTGDACCPSWRP